MVNISGIEVLQPEVDTGNLGLLLVDLQTRLAPAIAESPAVIDQAAKLLQVARAVDLPILATEQYSKGLGATVGALRRFLDPAEIIEKTAFGAPREEPFRRALATRGIGEVVVAGMEAHVCVQQTVLCLLEQGVAVSLVTDAVASRDPFNKEVAIQRMAAAGVMMVTAEAALARLQPTRRANG